MSGCFRGILRNTLVEADRVSYSQPGCFPDISRVRTGQFYFALDDIRRIQCDSFLDTPNNLPLPGIGPIIRKIGYFNLPAAHELT